jgi:hypothetical protein
MKWKIIIILFVLIIVGGFAYLKYPKNTIQKTNEIPVQEESQAQIDDIVPGEIKNVNESYNTFTHKKYGFSFEYPSNMSASNFAEGEGEQVVFQGDNKDWFQIYITPWDENGDITVNRIKKDLPDILISDPQTVILGPKQKEGIGPKALIFWSKDSGLGDTREVWFVYEGNLYQLTTYKRLDQMVGKVLSTLTFK